MSFAMQHGLQLSGNSFSLELKTDLALVPVKDGLVHRPNADWSVDYLSCDLTETKIWLCSSQHKHDEEVIFVVIIFSVKFYAPYLSFSQ